MGADCILLVEDDPNYVILTRRALEKHGVRARIDVAKDGEEALDRLFGTGPFEGESYWPDVILLDLKMPRVDGFEVLRRIRGNPRTKSLPVVILTSSKEHKDLLQGYDLGANSYVVKPIDFEELNEVVSRLGVYWTAANEPPPRPESGEPLNGQAS